MKLHFNPLSSSFKPSVSTDHTAHLNMYRMYGAQLDDDDDESSLNSSFWSDGEREEEEEEEEVEPVSSEGDFKPAAESHPKASGEEKAERNKCSMSEQSSDDEDEEDESCSSSCDSPAPSLMTSGYGTYRPEEQEGGDGSDAPFGRDSRGDLSELRDDEDDGRSLCSFAGLDEETRPLSVLADVEPEAHVAPGGDNGLCEGADVTTTEEEEECSAVSAGKLRMVGANLGGVDAEEEVWERPDEADESDESSSNRDIKFIDSRVEFSLMALEWEGNLRRRKGKQLPVCVARRLRQNIRSLGSHQKSLNFIETFHHELKSDAG